MAKYKKITIDHTISIKFFYYVTVSYPTFPTADVCNTTNNETIFPEPREFFGEDFVIKVHLESVLKYLNFRIF